MTVRIPASSGEHAAAARSILACPAGVELSIEGCPEVLAEEAPQGVHDWAGTPLLLCVPDGRVAHAGKGGRAATMALASGLSAGETLHLSGRLRWVTTDWCACCDTSRERVVLDLDEVRLQRDGRRIALPVPAFAHPALQLNAGLFRRTEQHLNECHGDHLRAAIANHTGTPVHDVVGVQLVGLSARRVTLRWVDLDGAGSAEVLFARAARDPEDLGDQLRRALHPELC